MPAGDLAPGRATNSKWVKGQGPGEVKSLSFQVGGYT
jgi:hypothetical protein